MWIQFLSWEDSQEQEVATHFRIIAWKIPWTEETGGATVHGIAEGQTQLSNLSAQSILTDSINK